MSHPIVLYCVYFEFSIVPKRNPLKGVDFESLFQSFPGVWFDSRPNNSKKSQKIAKNRKKSIGSIAIFSQTKILISTDQYTWECLSHHIQIYRIMLNCFLVPSYLKILRHALQIVNFIVFYPDDGSSGPHCLSLDNYNVDMDNDSPNHTWLLLEPSNP